MPNAEPCILIVEGNPSRRCDFQRSHGSETGSERYAGVVRALFPQTKIEFVNGADPDQSLPNGVSLSQFDGVIVGGSHLHAYDRTNPSVVFSFLRVNTPSASLKVVLTKLFEFIWSIFN